MGKAENIDKCGDIWYYIYGHKLRRGHRYGITCNAVGPTPIETDLIRGIPSEKIHRIVSNLAIKRMGRFEDIANVIDFFIKPESDYITGQVVYLGGV